MIKPIFGIDITKNKKDIEYKNEEFVVATLEQQQINSLQEQNEKLNDSINKTGLPTFFKIVKYLAGIIALIIFAGSIEAILEKGVATTYQKAPGFFYAFGISLIIFIVLFFVERKRVKTKTVEYNIEQQVVDFEHNQQLALSSLGVPANADNVDVLIFRYTEKDGEIKIKTTAMQVFQFINIDFSAYIEKGRLCLCDLESVYAFDLPNVKAISKINKTATFPFWTKPEKHNSESYKKYKIKTNNMSVFFSKPYYVLEVEHNSQTLGIYSLTMNLKLLKGLQG